MDKRSGKKTKVKKPAQSTVPASQKAPVAVPLKKPNSGSK
jgi:hypothetical protein